MRRKFLQFTPLTGNGRVLYFSTLKFKLCYAINSLCLNFFHLLTRKTNLEKFSIYSNELFHNFHLSESRFTCSGLWESGLARRLHWLLFILFTAWQPMTFIRRVTMKLHSADVLRKAGASMCILWVYGLYQVNFLTQPHKIYVCLFQGNSGLV